MVAIIPDPDQFQETLKLILELSDRPRDVKVVTVQAIDVPDVVAQRYVEFQQVDDREEVPEVPKKRGPGRPRKNPIPEEQ